MKGYYLSTINESKTKLLRTVAGLHACKRKKGALRRPQDIINTEMGTITGTIPIGTMTGTILIDTIQTEQEMHQFY